MSSTLELTFSERFYYSTTQPVTVKEIIDSLQGLEYIVKNTRHSLQKLTGCEIKEVQLFVDELKSGSLLEDVIVKVIFGNEEKKDAFLAAVHEKIGDGKMRNSIVGLVIGGMIGYGIYLAIKPSDPTYTIEANNNVIINIGDSSKLTEQGLLEVIKESITNQKALAQNTIKVLSPARGDANSKIEIGDIVNIPSTTIVNTPTKIEYKPLEEVIDYDNVTLKLRAMDLDKTSQGWAGVVSGLIDNRTKLTLAPNINTAVFLGKISVIADVTIIYKLQSKSNEYTPSEIYVRAVKN